MHPRTLLPARAALAASLLALGTAGAAAQGTPCTLEYRRADNMWANFGRADGNLGTETITLQPGQKKVFVTDWGYEKQRNDGTNYYGSHLRQAFNRGAGPVHMRLRGQRSYLIREVSPLAARYVNPSRPSGLAGTMVKLISLSFLRDTAALLPNDTALFRHDIMEVVCPDAPMVTATTTPPPPPPVLLAVTGTRLTATTTSMTITVTAQDAQSGAPLTGQVTINGVTGPTGQAITYSPCTETLEYENAKGITQTRTIRAPCEGTVKISGYPDVYFTF